MLVNTLTTHTNRNIRCFYVFITYIYNIHLYIHIYVYMHVYMHICGISTTGISSKYQHIVVVYVQRLYAIPLQCSMVYIDLKYINLYTQIQIQICSRFCFHSPQSTCARVSLISIAVSALLLIGFLFLYFVYFVPCLVGEGRQRERREDNNLR